MRDYLFERFPKGREGAVWACFFKCPLCEKEVVSQVELYPEQPFTEHIRNDMLRDLSITIGEHMLDHADQMHKSAMRAWPIIVAEYKPMTEMSLWKRIKHVFYPGRTIIACRRIQVTVPLVGKVYSEDDIAAMHKEKKHENQETIPLHSTVPAS